MTRRSVAQMDWAAHGDAIKAGFEARKSYRKIGEGIGLNEMQVRAAAIYGGPGVNPSGQYKWDDAAIDRVIVLLDAGKSTEQVAEIIGATKSSVQNAMSRFATRTITWTRK